MARYIIDEPNTTKYDKNYKMPLLNLIPAIVWSIPIYQLVIPYLNNWVSLGIAGLFIIAYVTLSYLPIVSIAPGVAGIVILSAMFWAPVDYIGSMPIRAIIKLVILAIAAFLELAIFANATIPWLDKRSNKTPRIRKIED